MNDDYYCPYCLVPLKRDNSTGHLFCNNTLINCNYRISPNSKAPLTYQQNQAALKLRYSTQIRQLEKLIRKKNKEIMTLNRKIKMIDDLMVC